MNLLENLTKAGTGRTVAHLSRALQAALRGLGHADSVSAAGGTQTPEGPEYCDLKYAEAVD